MKNNSQDLGKTGELLARKYLEKLGYEILETNWRFRKLEVDIISRSGAMMVFVEVKARSTDVFGEPEMFVTMKKQKFLVAAAHQYLIRYNITLESRFDVVSIVQENNKHTVKHIEGAFYPNIQ